MKVKVDQPAYRRAMLEQRQVRPDFFPVDNRAARRTAADDRTPPATSATGRQCGGCSLCCRLVPVEELHKPAGKRCKHQRFARGCMIYAVRPISCREWSCMWLIGDEGGQPLDLARPDRSHYVVDVMPDIIRITNNETGKVDQIDVMQVWVDPAYPDAWKDKALLDMIERVGVIALVRYDSDRGFVACPPSRSADRQWHFTDTQSAEDLRDAQRAARFAFFSQQAAR